MINIWNEMAEGHFDLPDNVVKNLSLVKDAANNFTNLQLAFEQKRNDLKVCIVRNEFFFHSKYRKCYFYVAINSESS